MVVDISDIKNSIRELLQPINTFSNVAGYKISSRKSVTLLYTNANVIYLHNGALLSGKKNDILKFACKLMKLEITTLSEVTQIDEYGMYSLISRY